MEYKGLVFGEVISGCRVSSYESELASARAKALKELEAKAKELGVNGTMLMVIASGTAVKLG